MSEIEHLRRQRMSGPAIARQLDMPVSTVGAHLRRLGFGKRAALDPKPAIVRYERERPGELIHLDTKKLGLIERIGHRITGDRQATAAASAGSAACSASTTPRGWPTARSCRTRRRRARSVLDRALAWLAGHGVTVERVMTDNGSAYRSGAFRHAVGDRRAPRHPHPALHAAYQRQGRALHPDQPARWAYARPCPSHERAAALFPWLHHYNTEWPHAGLAHRPPLTRLQSRCLVRPKEPLLIPTCQHRRRVRRAGAAIAEGDRRQPARSVLAATRRSGHALKEGPYA